MTNIDAYLQVDETKRVFAAERSGVDERFTEIYNAAVAMAECVGEVPNTPRIAARQKNRSNAPATSPEEYYRVNVAVKFLDHIICSLDSKFSSEYFVYNTSYMYLVVAIFWLLLL